MLTIVVEDAARGHEGETLRRRDAEEIEVVHARILLNTNMKYGSRHNRCKVSVPRRHASTRNSSTCTG